MLKTPLPPRGATALVLGRYSSKSQNLLASDDQIATRSEACKKFGWEVKYTFKDEAKSGRPVAKRSGNGLLRTALYDGGIVFRKARRSRGISC